MSLRCVNVATSFFCDSMPQHKVNALSSSAEPYSTKVVVWQQRKIFSVARKFFFCCGKNFFTVRKNIFSRPQVA